MDLESSGKLRKELDISKDRSFEIVDYFHALQVERPGDFAKSRPTWTADFRREWLLVQKARLKAGEIDGLSAMFRIVDKLEKEEMDSQHAYWQRNNERLRYAYIRSKGLAIGSGAVESSVRRVVNLRLKGAWSPYKPDDNKYARKLRNTRVRVDNIRR